MRRKTLTDKGVEALKPRGARYAFSDPELGGHFVRVQPSGAKSYCAVARDPVSGRQVWATIGGCDLFGIAEARETGREAIKRIKAGQPAFDPVLPKSETFGAVAATWIKRHVEANSLRSKYEIERILRRYIIPDWKDRDFAIIRRSDVVALLDRVQDEHGA